MASQGNNAAAIVAVDALHGSPTQLPDLQSKYDQERDKRMRDDGDKQFIDIAQTSKYARFGEDPWAISDLPPLPVPNGGNTKVAIVGVGFAGVQMAVNLVRAGFKPEDLVLTDLASGFGGTWHWNRYPGLMCDVESYMYLPFVEETGYIPKRRYAGGEEIRQYINLVIDHYKLRDRGLLQTTVKTMTWDEDKKVWTIKGSRKPKDGTPEDISFNADFVWLASGILNNPKLPDLPGLDDFNGHCFHTARWDYESTGGSPANPVLDKLKDKTVGIIGTGATAIQAVPHLAKYAKKLYVFQRTPTAVDVRDNRDTDPADFHKTIATGPGWWWERNANWWSWVSASADPKTMPNIVKDGWTDLKSYRAVIGGSGQNITPENVAEYRKNLHVIDVPRAERIRARVTETVKDPETAKGLQAWYPSWCKRPGFHDEYLQTFNEPNVELVDTDGKGLDGLTADAVKANGKTFPVDILVFSTGFRSPALGSPACKGQMTVTGRNGIGMKERNEEGMYTLHGITTPDFPNMFFAGLSQTASGPNHVFTLDILTRHLAHVLWTTTNNGKSKVIIEPTKEGVQTWAGQILQHAINLAGFAGCTPSYYTNEGQFGKHIENPQDQMKMAAFASYGRGVIEFNDILEQWRADGNFKGLDIKPVGRDAGARELAHI